MSAGGSIEPRISYITLDMTAIVRFITLNLNVWANLQTSPSPPNTVPPIAAYLTIPAVTS